VPLLRSTKTFLRGLEQPQRRRKMKCLQVRLRFETNLSVPMPSLARPARVYLSRYGVPIIRKRMIIVLNVGKASLAFQLTNVFEREDP